MEHAHYFANDNYLALVAVITQRSRAGDPDAEEDAVFLEEHFRNIFAYVDGVCRSEVGIHMASIGLEGQALQQRVTELDRMRSKHHDAAIASASAVNRIAAFYGVGPIYTGDLAVRRQVAAFCMEVVSILFENRR